MKPSKHEKAWRRECRYRRSAAVITGRSWGQAECEGYPYRQQWRRAYQLDQGRTIVQNALQTGRDYNTREVRWAASQIVREGRRVVFSLNRFAASFARFADSVQQFAQVTEKFRAALPEAEA